MPQKPDDSSTIVITNFGGRLTRKLNGEMNSGYAKFNTSWGYDPFTKPDNLTWLEKPVDISSTSGSSITGLVLTAKNIFSPAALKSFTYIVDSGAVSIGPRFYQVTPNDITNPNLDSTSVLSSLTGIAFNNGASMEQFGSSSTFYIGSDSRIDKINTDGSGQQIATSNVLTNKYHPLTQFVGKLVIGNGNNVQTIDSTGTLSPSLVSSGSDGYGVISPPMPVGTFISDLDTSPDGNYLDITASNISPEQVLTVSNDRQAAATGKGNLFRWNGVDVGITSQNFIASYQVTALQTYLDNQIIFANDSFGASLNDGVNKIVSLPNNKSPLPNATDINGNFVTWANPEVDQNSSIAASLYYYGNLDNENQPGLWRVMRYYASIASGFVYQTPVNVLVNNRYQTVNNSISSVVSLGYGKHYVSVMEVNSSGVPAYRFLRFLVTSTGTGTPQNGVYETQTQLFSKKIVAKQIRVYTEPTVSGNGFQIQLIGSDGNPLTNGTYSYSFSAGTDPTLLQGSLQRIDFNPTAAATFALGVRIVNTGTVNMTIKKIEIDPSPQGK